MAKERLSAATFVTRGEGQLEDNHLSARRTGQIYAQLPLASTVSKLENGQFAKYDLSAGAVNFTGKGEFMLCNTTPKLYHADEADEDFAVKAPMYPRMFKTNIGDIFTTNTITGTTETIKKDAVLVPNASTGILEVKQTPAATDMQWLVVKVYTLPDGKPAAKLVRIN